MRVWLSLLMWSCLLGALFRAPAAADPGPIGSYLMSQKASLFSFGMLRLDMALQRVHEQLSAGGFISAYYNWDKNRIEITGLFENQVLSKERCKYFIDYIKSHGGIDPSTGRPVMGDASTYSVLFNDIGFELKSKPDDMESRLAEIIKLRITLLQS